MLPEYDRESNQVLDERIYHDNVNVTSQILGNLLISFLWRPIINEEMIQDFRAWTRSMKNLNSCEINDVDYTVPDLIFLGELVPISVTLSNNNQVYGVST